MGKTGQDHVNVLFGNGDQCLLQCNQQCAQHVDLAAQPQAYIGGNLVVAAAAGVQALAGVTDQLGQARFNVQVHVFEVEFPFEGAGFDFCAQRRHTALDGAMVGCADDALGRQHFGVRQTASDIR